METRTGCSRQKTRYAGIPTDLVGDCGVLSGVGVAAGVVSCLVVDAGIRGVDVAAGGDYTAWIDTDHDIAAGMGRH